MNLPDIRAILQRDLATLARELRLYPDDAAPWAELPGLPNSGGTLALHIAGNLRHFIGATLGQSGYVRDRDQEFAARGLSRETLISLVEAAAREVDAALAQLAPGSLDAPYPLRVREVQLSTGRLLIHLCGHTAFHLGQIDYHRRAATGDRQGAGALGLSELAVSDQPSAED